LRISFTAVSEEKSKQFEKKLK